MEIFFSINWITLLCSKWALAISFQESLTEDRILIAQCIHFYCFSRFQMLFSVWMLNEMMVVIKGKTTTVIYQLYQLLVLASDIPIILNVTEMNASTVDWIIGAEANKNNHVLLLSIFVLLWIMHYTNSISISLLLLHAVLTFKR